MKWFLALFAALAMTACPSKETPAVGDPDHGKMLIDKYGCTACHEIPGIAGPHGMVGPPLTKIGSRGYIAGKFPNTPPMMTQWLQNPQGMDPANSMPNLGVTAADARDITAYLESLK